MSRSIPVYSEVKQICELPKIDQISTLGDRNKRNYVTLAVMVLSYYHDKAWNNGNRPGILLVTDFSINEQLLFPRGTPEIFTFGGEKMRLPKEKILSLSVSKNLFPYILNKLKQALAMGEEYDFNEYNQCLVDKEKIMANVSFRLKAYDGRLEGSIDGIDGFSIIPSTCSNPEVTRLQRSFARELPDDYISYGTMPPPSCIPPVIERSNKRVKIETKVEYSQIPDSIDEFSQEHRDLMNDDMEESQLFSQPENETNGAHVEGEEEGYGEGEEEREDEEQEQEQERGEEKETKIHTDSRDTSDAAGDTADQNSQASVKVRPPSAPSAPSASSYPLNKIFNVEGIVKLVTPRKFVIKPYGRTLKIAPFKIIVQSEAQGEARIFELSLITESEICNFLGLIEIEEALEALPTIEKMMRTLELHGTANSPSTLKIQKRTHRFLSANVEMEYWTCLTSLADLAEK